MAMISVLTSGVGRPIIFDCNRAGEPSLSCKSCNGTMTFGGSILSISSFVGGGALTSNFLKLSGSTNGRVSIDDVGRIVNSHDVSSLPTGFVALTVYLP